jgi:hypothetical protein
MNKLANASPAFPAFTTTDFSNTAACALFASGKMNGGGPSNLITPSFIDFHHSPGVVPELRLPDMGRPPTSDPKLWRTRANQIRALAERMHDQLAKDVMLRLADDYERSAQEVERRNQPNAR